jgi:4'-phosphopantetheinyl transferase
MGGQNSSRLASDEVHVWTYEVPPSLEPSDDCWLSHLSADERVRHDRFLFEKDRRLFRAAHSMVRAILSSYVDAPMESWRFQTNAYGRPHVAAPAQGSHLYFNLSHTAGMAAVVVSREPEVGVDVERRHRPNVGVALADRYFSSSEVAFLAAEPVEEQPRRFLEIWTLKEAYIKARGKGLAIPLSEFSFQFPKEGGVQISFAAGFDDRDDAWIFEQRLDLRDHLLALAVRRRPAIDWRIQWKQWEPSFGDSPS